MLWGSVKRKEYFTYSEIDTEYFIYSEIDTKDRMSILLGRDSNLYKRSEMRKMMVDS